MEAVSTYKQSLFDVALQHLGDAQKALDLAVLNGRSLTDDLEPGEVIIFDETQKNRQMTQYYSVNALQPATALSETVDIPGGINFMGIEIDFIVS